MSLTFDAPTHTYRWKGVVVRSVTQILEDAFRRYASVSDDVLQVAQLRGTNVHLMCQFFDEDALDENEFTPEERVYLPGWQKFLAEHQPNWSAIEVPFYSQTYGYPGTPDREGSLRVKGERIENAMIDIKTSVSSSPLWGLQTAAYCQGKADRRRFTVQLAANGTFKLIEWTDPTDWPSFVSILTFQRWISRHL